MIKFTRPWWQRSTSFGKCLLLIALLPLAARLNLVWVAHGIGKGANLPLILGMILVHRLGPFVLLPLGLNTFLASGLSGMPALIATASDVTSVGLSWLFLRDRPYHSGSRTVRATLRLLGLGLTLPLCLGSCLLPALASLPAWQDMPIILGQAFASTLKTNLLLAFGFVPFGLSLRASAHHGRHHDTMPSHSTENLLAASLFVGYGILALTVTPAYYLIATQVFLLIGLLRFRPDAMASAIGFVVALSFAAPSLHISLLASDMALAFTALAIPQNLILLCAFTFICATAIDERRRAQGEQLQTKELLRQREKDLAHAARQATLGTLAAGINHEISQPLQSIVSFADSAAINLRRDPPRIAEAQANLEKVIQATKAAKSLVVNLRELLYREEDEEISILNLNVIVKEALMLLDVEAQRYGVVMDEELVAPAPYVLADALSLQQAIINVVLNACEAAASGPALKKRVHVRTQIESDRVIIKVIDNGPGVSSDITLFETCQSTRKKGLGMGLAVAHTLITNIGGQLWYKPMDGYGASFIFSLPLTHAPRTSLPAAS